MIWTIITICVWILIILLYVIFNLYNKNVKLENTVLNYSSYINEFSLLLEDFDDLTNKIDSQIWVQSDPELLSLFEKAKEIQNKSKSFIK